MQNPAQVHITVRQEHRNKRPYLRIVRLQLQTRHGLNRTNFRRLILKKTFEVKPQFVAFIQKFMHSYPTVKIIRKPTINDPNVTGHKGTGRWTEDHPIKAACTSSSDDVISGGFG
jgi:type IV secretory pathway TraG/TraD family ATPase VirD4